MDSQNIKVSVIVPVYNAQLHLRQCIDSIISQTLTDIEIILVDDGSTDSSLAILNEYAQKDSRVTVLTQENKFAGAARNAGKAIAQGKYLVFWDSDDYFFPDALLHMYEQCEADDADMCVCGGKQYFEDIDLEIDEHSYLNTSRIPEQVPFNRLTNPDYILNFTSESPWNKMFLRSFVEDNKLDFQAIRNGNDVFFVVNAICLSSRITVVDEPLICYRKDQSTSLVGTLYKSPLSPLQAWLDSFERLSELDALPYRSFINRFSSSAYFLLHYMSTWESYEQGFKFLKDVVFPKFGMEKLESDFFYSGRHYEFVSHLLNEDEKDFLAFYNRLTFSHFLTVNVSKKIQTQKVKNLRAKLKSSREAIHRKNDAIKKSKLRLEKKDKKIARLEKENRSIKSSSSYRIGRIITFIPRKIIGIFKR